MDSIISMMKSSAMELKKTVALTVTAMLSALDVVLGFFTFMIGDFIKVSFSYLAIGLSGMFYGPVVGGITGAVGDLLKFAIRPLGPFFPGMTVSACLTGVIYGLFLYKKPATLSRILLAKICVTLIVDLGLTTLWLTMMYGKGFMVLLPMRALKSLIMLPIDTAMLYMVAKIAAKVKLPKKA